MATIALADMDVVYPVVVKGDNDELRYSLRSLENLPHRRVIVISAGIDWLSDKVVQLKTDVDMDTSQSAFSRVNVKLAQVAHDESVSDKFVLMNDDFFIMRRQWEIPYFCLGKLEDRLARYDRYGSYARDLDMSKAWLERRGFNSLDFEAHAPIIFRKNLLTEVTWACQWSGHRRSLYCNKNGVKPTFIESDFKVYAGDPGFSKGRRFISTEDASFANDAVGEYIRERFPNKCEYEA